MMVWREYAVQFSTNAGLTVMVHTGALGSSFQSLQRRQWSFCLWVGSQRGPVKRAIVTRSCMDSGVTSSFSAEYNLHGS